MEKPIQITRRSKSDYHEMIAAMGERVPGTPSQIPLWVLSKSASERLITGDSVPIPDCISCGACCVYARLVPVDREETDPSVEYVDITLDDADEIVIERVLPRGDDGNCKFLSGDTGIEVGCTIYSSRPAVCRNFEAGSDRCHGYRRMLGIEPALSDKEVAAANKKLKGKGTSNRIPEIAICLESIRAGIDFSKPEGERGYETKTLSIYARMQDESITHLHTYDSKKEVWFEHDLEGCTLEEAMALIEEKKAQ